MAELTYAQVSLLLKYEPETGKLFWKERPPELFKDGSGSKSSKANAARWNGRYAGKEAFTARVKGGYLVGRIFDIAYYAHHIAWLLHHGEWPNDMTDHENGTRDENRISNLRDTTRIGNAKNQKRRTDNTSGVVGVSQLTKTGQWQAYISKNQKRFGLGIFDTKGEAITVRKEAEIDAGYHPNHGRE